MVTISINDELRQFAQPVALEELLLDYRRDNPDLAFAVAVNGEFVPRTQYAQVQLGDGDTLDIVRPVGGG
ncbi:sulfur carrier protein ThiS [Saccharophagus sp. K07]|jgi:sulfur carrier protein|uniref:sulfur carrier protein ThiS n=1 Tax=Saccharophagus sp. K07 TaxID=2283636 RepID=UPI001652649B|nr:sulfur carrier protein ThiS [Saccharophagus sp. K07]MBC6907062.1 sulfur carrier protein ThiS [Saccharophagus sp. K07]